MILITDTPLEFNCFKAYEEDTYYTSGENVVIFRSLYHYATIIYQQGCEIPQKSVDGNYYNIPDPFRAECGDLLIEKIEVHIQDPAIKIVIQDLLIKTDPLELDQKFKDLGFSISSRQIMYGQGTVVTQNKDLLPMDFSSMGDQLEAAKTSNKP